jgi:hypothetical protein
MRRRADKASERQTVILDGICQSLRLMVHIAIADPAAELWSLTKSFPPHDLRGHGHHWPTSWGVSTRGCQQGNTFTQLVCS